MIEVVFIVISSIGIGSYLLKKIIKSIKRPDPYLECSICLEDFNYKTKYTILTKRNR